MRDTGVVVVRGVMPKDMTEALLSDARAYFASHSFKGFPSDTEKKVSRRFQFATGGPFCPQRTLTAASRSCMSLTGVHRKFERDPIRTCWRPNHG